MKYIKLFEKFIENPKFYRFNQFDLLGDKQEMQFTPKPRKMVGPESVNKVLVKNGFPDKNRCIHFMDSLSFNPDYKSLYGDFIYEIQIDDQSKLGWSFFCFINDWFYKGHSIYSERNNPAIQDLLNSEYKDLNYYDERRQGDLDKMVEYCIEYEVIGTGTIEDLKKSKFFGKQKLFVWTDSDVIIKKYEAPKKEPKPYKNEPVLIKNDFSERGIEPQRIGEFWKSEIGKRVKSENLDRKEALKSLEDWIKTQAFRF
jgi:hypothetical protein